MRIAILASGTRGDIQPALAIGDELMRRGHSVALTVNPNLVSWAQRTDIEIVPLLPDFDHVLKSPDGQSMLASGNLKALSREIARRERLANREISEACITCCEGADLVLSTVFTAYRGACIAERSGAVHGLLLFCPMHPTSTWTHVLMPVRDLWMGALNRGSFSLAFHMWWRDSASNVAEMRKMLGLPSSLARPRPERLRSVGAFSAHLAPRPADWAEDQVVTGFVSLPRHLRERLGEASAVPGLDDWLSRGEPPVYFGFGSMPVLQPEAFIEQVAALAARRRLRALVCAGWTDFTGSGPRSDDVFVCSSVDHDVILPRCRAAIHHGGAGTTAAALRAGLPSFVASVFADQPFWGWRIQLAGAGVTMPYQRLDRRTMGRALDALLDSATVDRAQRLGAKVRAEEGTCAAADAIESWASHV